MTGGAQSRCPFQEHVQVRLCEDAARRINRTCVCGEALGNPTVFQRGVSGRPRPIGRLPAPPVRSVHGPTPQLTPCRRYAWWLVDAQGSTGSSRCTSERGRNGPCFAIHPSGFPCAYAGSDGCPVFTRETSPVKSCGLYTDAALRGRLVPLEEVHLAEIQA